MDSTSNGATSRGGPEAMLPGPGDTILGKYRIDAVIGEGGMGIVLGGMDLSLGRPVAIKFLSPDRASRPGAAMRFLREARSAAMIQSEHVVRVYEVSQLPNGAPFIVMEHLRGTDLAHVLKHRGPLPFQEACDILLQACEALGEAHMRGIVHRDLKPQNLFYTQTPDGMPLVKVLDFGISKLADDSPDASNLTATDTVMGTPLYMSPEQVRSLKNVDARSDIWALGSILFELLTNAPIFQAPSASALCAMIAMDPPRPLRSVRGDAPPGLEAIILRCLHKDPNGRFPDVAALAEVLAPFATDRGQMSAMRIARVVRSSPSNPGPAPTWQSAAGGTALGMASTVGDAPLYRPSGHPSGGAPNPTTQSNWQRASHTGPAPVTQKGSSGAVVAVLGLFAGLLVLCGAVAGGWFLLSKRTPTVAEAPDAGAAVVTAAPAATSPPTTASTLPTAAPATPPPVPAHHAGKDAGAPGAAKDAGAPSAPSGPSTADVTAQKRIADQNCAYNHGNMNRFGQTPQQKKEEAQRAKGFMCRGQAMTSCERRICREACTILSDDDCLRQVDYIENFSPAPKY